MIHHCENAPLIFRFLVSPDTGFWSSHEYYCEAASRNTSFIWAKVLVKNKLNETPTVLIMFIWQPNSISQVMSVPPLYHFFPPVIPVVTAHLSTSSHIGCLLPSKHPHKGDSSPALPTDWPELEFHDTSRSLSLCTRHRCRKRQLCSCCMAWKVLTVSPTSQCREAEVASSSFWLVLWPHTLNIKKLCYCSYPAAFDSASSFSLCSIAALYFENAWWKWTVGWPELPDGHGKQGKTALL